MTILKRKTSHGFDQVDEKSPHCSSARLDIELNSLTEEQVAGTALRIENELIGKRKKRSGNQKEIY